MGGITVVDPFRNYSCCLTDCGCSFARLRYDFGGVPPSTPVMKKVVMVIHSVAVFSGIKHNYWSKSQIYRQTS